MADVADNDETYKRYCRLYPYGERFSRTVVWQELMLQTVPWPPPDWSLRVCHENLLRKTSKGMHGG